MRDFLWMQVIDAEIATLEAKLSYVHADLYENLLRREYARFRRQKVSETAPERIGEIDEIIGHLEEMHDALMTDRQKILTQLERGCDDE